MRFAQSTMRIAKSAYLKQHVHCRFCSKTSSDVKSILVVDRGERARVVSNACREANICPILCHSLIDKDARWVTFNPTNTAICIGETFEDSYRSQRIADAASLVGVDAVYLDGNLLSNNDDNDDNDDYVTCKIDNNLDLIDKLRNQNVVCLGPNEKALISMKSISHQVAEDEQNEREKIELNYGNYNYNGKNEENMNRKMISIDVLVDSFGNGVYLTERDVSAKSSSEDIYNYNYNYGNRSYNSKSPLIAESPCYMLRNTSIAKSNMNALNIMRQVAMQYAIDEGFVGMYTFYFGVDIDGIDSGDCINTPKLKEIKYGLQSGYCATDKVTAANGERIKIIQELLNIRNKKPLSFKQSDIGTISTNSCAMKIFINAKYGIVNGHKSPADTDTGLNEQDPNFSCDSFVGPIGTDISYVKLHYNYIQPQCSHSFLTNNVLRL